jgi:hypothetical protein
MHWGGGVGKFVIGALPTRGPINANEFAQSTSGRNSYREGEANESRGCD